MIEFLTSNPELAGAISAIVSIFVATTAVIISGISLWVSLQSLRIQRKHNILSVKPIPEITVADYEDSLRVKMKNNGNGPMIVKNLEVVGPSGSENSVIACMGELPNGRAWTHFATDFENRVLMPGQFLPLLELTKSDGEQGFDLSRNSCRSWLSKLECCLTYSDIYESKFVPYTKSLKWFGRRISEYKYR